MMSGVGMATVLIFLRNSNGLVATQCCTKCGHLCRQHKSMQHSSKQMPFRGIILGSSMFTGEIQPMTCSLSNVELRGVVAYAEDGRDTPYWPTLYMLVWPSPQELYIGAFETALHLCTS